MTGQQGQQQITVQADQRLRPDLPAGMWAQIMQLVQTAPVSWQTANPLVQAGIEAVGWAPGNEETYHEPNEEIEISQLTTFAGRLANLASEICSMET